MRKAVFAASCFLVTVSVCAQVANNLSSTDIDGLSVCKDSNVRSSVFKKLHFPPLSTDVEVEVGQSIVSYFNVYVVETDNAFLVEFGKTSSFRGNHAFQDFEATIPVGLTFEFNSSGSSYKVC
jgi:hypothetical protein